MNRCIYILFILFILASSTCENLFTNEDKYCISELYRIIVLHMSQLLFYDLQKRNVYIHPITATIICSCFIGRLSSRIDFDFKINVISVSFLFDK